MISRKKKWQYPLSHASDYERKLVVIADELVRHVEQALLLHQDDNAEWYAGLLRTLMRLPQQLSLMLQDVAVGVQVSAASINRFNLRQFKDVVKSALGLEFYKPEQWLDDAIATWTAANVSLIKSIPDDYLQKIQQIVATAAANGTSQKDLIKQIRATYRLPIDRAQLIANDQVSKLNSQLTRQRQQSIGIKQYRWRGTLDKRERDSHLKREGKIFDWDNPPSDGHPGTAIRCRCHAEPIFPELKDIDALLFAEGDNRHYQAEMARRKLK